MNFSKEFEEALHLIKQKNNILLAVHERPDGDALGSMIAVFSILQAYEDKKVVMFSNDPVPEYLKFLPYFDRIVRDARADGFIPDLFLGFDYGDFKRLGVDLDFINSARIITFDHHPYFRQKGDVLIIDESASSTCEIVYEFLRSAGYHISMTTAIALLTGIFTDTGGFAHINTSINTLRAAANLLRCGASIPKLQKYTFSYKSVETLRVWGAILRNILHDKETGMAYAIVSYPEFRGMRSALTDFEGIVNIIDMPPDVRFSLLLIEYEPGVIKGSMRSEPFKNADVSQIARALGGGGHKYAAGFEVQNDTLKNVVERVKIISKRKRQGRLGRAVRQGSAKPCTAVQLRQAPPKYEE